MGAAADLLGELAHGVHLDALAVLALKQAHCALRLGLGHGHFLAHDGSLGLNGHVHQALDLGLLLLGHLAAEGEVEAQALGGDVGALLRDLRAQNLAQRGVQQVGGGVQLRGLLAVVGQTALEALLRTGVAVLLMLLEALLKAGLVHGHALLGGHLPGDLDGEAVGVVELEGAAAVDHGAGGDLLIQRGIVDAAVLDLLDHGQVFRRGGQLLQRGGDGVGVGLVGLQGLEGGPAALHVAVDLLELRLTLLQRALEAFLLQLELLQDEPGMALQLRIVVLVLVDDDLGDLAGEALGHAQLHAVAHGAADQAAQHVALIHVGRGHAAVVADDEGGGAHVIGDDADGLGGFLVLAVLLAGQLLDLADDAREDFGLVDGLYALEHAVGALQAHAGVHVLLLQRDERAVGLLLILHEHVVPDLQIASAGAVGAAVRAAGGLFGDPEHLGIRAAGAGDAGGAPPVVLLGQVEQVIVLHALRAPEVCGLLVAGAIRVARKHRKRKAILGQTQPLLAGQELPAPRNHLLLEVVAQRPVAQHLEEGQVAGIANVVDVAGADALLHVGQAMAHGVLFAHQIGNQRMHARGGEQHGGVVLGNDRRAGDHGVSLGFKELEKQGSQIVVGLDVGIHDNLPPYCQK